MLTRPKNPFIAPASAANPVPALPNFDEEWVSSESSDDDMQVEKAQPVYPDELRPEHVDQFVNARFLVSKHTVMQAPFQENGIMFQHGVEYAEDLGDQRLQREQWKKGSPDDPHTEVSSGPRGRFQMPRIG